MSAVVEHRHRVTAPDGIELAAWLASPSDARAVMLLCHGLTTDADEHGAFPALRDRALRERFAVVRFDFRAHGRSEGSNEEFTLAGLRLDVEAMLDLIDRELPSGLPLIPIGLSFGGAPAVHAASVRSPCAGLVLWYAVTDYYSSYRVDSTVPFTRRMRAAADPGSDPPWAEMPVLGTNWYFPKAMLVETTDDNTPDRLRRLPVPVLAYYGSRDTFVDVTQLRRVAAQRSDVELRIAHGAGHGFLLWRPWVIRQTVAWAAQVASSHAAGDSPRSD